VRTDGHRTGRELSSSSQKEIFPSNKRYFPKIRGLRQVSLTDIRRRSKKKRTTQHQPYKNLFKSSLQHNISTKQDSLCSSPKDTRTTKIIKYVESKSPYLN